MNQEQTTRLIEMLVDKTLSFGCKIQIRNGDLYNDYVAFEMDDPTLLSGIKLSNAIDRYEAKILGHPIRIGDVLLKINEIWTDEEVEEKAKNHALLVRKWESCGFTKSLQELIEESGWGNLQDDRAVLMGEKLENLVPHEKRAIKQVYYIKNPQTRALVEFLGEIFLK